jgi:signal transduction protein with GAF and PtsI domain
MYNSLSGRLLQPKTPGKCSNSAVDAIEDSIERTLSERGATPEALHAVLERILALFDCQVGTLHRLDAASQRLHLLAHRGVPESILGAVREIPVGKGMAGLAAERRQPVQVCNLQRDDSGVAKPAARETRMEGSVALPILVEGELRGTLGVAKPIVYEFTSEEIARLLAIASRIGRFLPRALGAAEGKARPPR